MAMYGKVRRMRYRDGLSISEIARRTSLSRNTIKTWLREPVRSGMTYRRPGGPCKLGAHADWFAQALEADARRPRKERRTALRLLAQLREQGYGGGYSQVTAFIRSWRAKAGAVTARSGYVPLRFDWGEVRGRFYRFNTFVERLAREGGFFAVMDGPCVAGPSVISCRRP